MISRQFEELLATLVVFCLYAWSLSERTFPNIAPDELGYISQAQMLAGVQAINMGPAPYYHFGYSLLLTPLCYLFTEPISLYRSIMVLNAVLAAALVPSLLAVSRGFGFTPTRLTIVAASAAALCPSQFYVAHYAWSEAAFRLSFVVSVIALMRLSERGSVFYVLAYALATVGLYSIHPRAMPVLFVALGSVFLLWRTKAIEIAAFIAGVLAIGAGALAVFLVARQFQAALWDGSGFYSITGHYRNALLGLGDPNALRITLSIALGQSWYQTVASFSLVIVGIGFLLRDLHRRQKPQLINSLYIILAVLAISAASIGITTPPLRIDDVAYGRYIDGVSFVVTWLGLVTLLNQSERSFYRPLMIVSAAALVIGGLVLANSDSVASLYPAHPVNMAGIGALFSESSPAWAIFALGSFVGISGIVFLLAVKPPLQVAGIIVFAIVNGWSIHHRHEGGFSQLVKNALIKDAVTIKALELDHIYWTNRSHHALYLFLLQFAAQRSFELWNHQDSKIAEGRMLVIDRQKPDGPFSCVIELNLQGLVGFGPGTRSRVPISLYQPLDFSRATICAEGWHSTEVWGRWSDGKRAALDFEVPGHEDPMVLELETRGFITDNLREQRIDVFVNGHQVTQWVFNSSNRGAVEYIAVPARTKFMRLEFIIPNANSPINVGFSQDTRVLGLGVSKICLAKEGRSCLGDMIRAPGR